MSDPNLFLIEAVIQEFPNTTYLKTSYIHGNDDVNWHMQALQGINYRVASVKSRPALQVDLDELMYDKQGNQDVIDDTTLVLGVDDEVQDSNTGPESSSN